MIIIPEDALRIAEALSTPIDELGLSVRSYNGLRRWGITTVADVYRAYQNKQLPRIRNIGEKSVIEIEKLLEEHLAKVAPVNNSETPNSSDCISRQAAIDCVMECYDNDELFEVYEDRLNELPPAQPAPSQVAADIARIVENGKDMRVIGQGRIRGRWIPVGGALYQCDQCGAVSLERKFCSDCGADMKGKDNETD